MVASLLEMRNISKSFGAVKALKGAGLHLSSGEVHALLGANGAGKSTLIKILSGAYSHDEGDIYLDGKPVSISSPKEAKDLGIHCVYQEVDTALVPQLTVAENILLDSFAGGSGFFVSKKKLRRKAEEILALLNEEQILVDQYVSQLTLAQKQMVLIARGLVKEADIIILDEPTAPLSIEETKYLFNMVRKLKTRGVGIIFISHRLPEVFEISDRITVMRDGATIGTVKTTEASHKQIVEAMLGKDLVITEKQKTVPGKKLLEVDGISDGGLVKNANLSVSRGEIVGVAGLVGAGKTELSRILFGLTKTESGVITMNGKRVPFKSPADAIRAGVVLIPEERRKEGLFINESIQHNLTFPHIKSFSSFLFMNRKLEKMHAEKIIKDFGVKTGGSTDPVLHLSGGNQQKVAIGKWTGADSDLYLFDEPTKGVDIGAKKEIFDLIQSLADQGKGILYLTSEISEILTVSDRILVMYDGMIVKELSREEASQEKILLYASGGKEESDEQPSVSVCI
ncbi:sugar ABC transporter ATP-binding protein [Rossellomorea vietnamensis]|uniref:Sugar ABC transporter ATP-binding protein n=1 Tax=Rossellomorea vietnamensis TaxID=218284 RepID=A0A5D4NUU7_9BACI|nr:sugar ABC transporter ATP-binding protein [Rossellomorea vietnamensis]TYS17106.1 sugar ABC transporter ATP-binding protein [Rossellomorea vietnamensis]